MHPSPLLRRAGYVIAVGYVSPVEREKEKAALRRVCRVH